MEKHYTIFAGVNGAGKSTLYQTIDDLALANAIKINADDTLRSFGGDWQNLTDNFKAMRITVKRLHDAFDNGNSIVHETTLSTNLKQTQKRIELAHRLGYQVELLYVGVATPEIAIERVRSRVLKGGHGVDEQTIRRRYQTSLERLNQLIWLCDNAEIYDNTYDQLRLVYRRTGKRIDLDRLDTIPWFKLITPR